MLRNPIIVHDTPFPETTQLLLSKDDGLSKPDEKSTWA